MTFLSKVELRGKKTNFLGINNVKFKRKIVPGETLTIHATLESFRRGIATGKAVSFVGEQPACSADFVVAVPDVLDQFKPKVVS
jgi:3-hydroxyacyl-[acyl-carrier-protein] dehydratase